MITEASPPTQERHHFLTHYPNCQLYALPTLYAVQMDITTSLMRPTVKKIGASAEEVVASASPDAVTPRSLQMTRGPDVLAADAGAGRIP